jgi:hypothetical protein
MAIGIRTLAAMSSRTEVLEVISKVEAQSSDWNFTELLLKKSV